jgi:hypothetical protein
MSGTLTAVSETSQIPYGGAGDAQAGTLELSARFRGHANALVRADRSPLYIRLMRAAADDIDAGGVVARLFAGIPTPPGSVPQLRLMGALHYMVLAGHAPALAAFYPSAGGDRPPDGVWPVADAVMAEQFDRVRERLHRTVQTNEPGRSAVLFAGLLWLTDRHRRPIRLLEIGASAGLNLLADRYSYTVDGRELGDRDSPLRFVDPWTGPPPIDLPGTASSLRIVARAGCDLSPLDPARAEDRLTLLSYIWPDELHRIDRMRAALSVAERGPVTVVARPASEWLVEALADGSADELVVVWHSVMRQYVEPEEWSAIERALSMHPRAVRLSMEPVRDRPAPMQLTVHDPVGAPPTPLAACDDHGLPIRWET